MTRALTLAAVLLLLPGVAVAQQPQLARCADRVGILAELLAQYSEVPRAAGITKEGLLLEITVAPSGSWTVLLTQPGGRGCIMSVGREWQFIAAPTFKRDL